MQGSLMAASLEGYVIDNDMLGAIQQAVRGVEVTDETLAFDMIEEVTDGPGHYLGHPQTLERMKRDFVYPIVADRQSYDQWWETGSRDVRQRARDYCMEILKSTGSSCIPTAIDERIRHQLDIRLSRQYMRFGANL
jgi:trimethylamine--corrinoid protein Co-methyltransferase